MQPVLVTATTVAAKGPCNYFGFIITTVTAVATIQIRDADAAATGRIIDVIPAATAVGTVRYFSKPIDFNLGLTVDFNGGTGALTLLMEGNP